MDRFMTALKTIVNYCLIPKQNNYLKLSKSKKNSFFKFVLNYIVYSVVCGFIKRRGPGGGHSPQLLLFGITTYSEKNMDIQ